MKNLNEFRNDNTNGIYSPEELKSMNDELAAYLDDERFDSIDQVEDSLLRYYVDKVINQH